MLVNSDLNSGFGFCSMFRSFLCAHLPAVIGLLLPLLKYFQANRELFTRRKTQVHAISLNFPWLEGSQGFQCVEEVGAVNAKVSY